MDLQWRSHGLDEQIVLLDRGALQSCFDTLMEQIEFFPGNRWEKADIIGVREQFKKCKIRNQKMLPGKIFYLCQGIDADQIRENT